MLTFVPEPALLAAERARDWPAHPGPAPGVRTGRPPARADVVVIGAGPAGLAMAAALWHLGVRDVVVLDRDGVPCDRFFRRIDGLGQRVLRSPYDHHPGVEGYHDCELLDFARLHWEWLSPVERREIRMAQAGHRSVVPVDVFEAFCHHVAAVHDVYDRTWCTTVREVRQAGDGVLVRTDDGTLAARFAVLCQGEQRTPAPAGWWPDGRRPASVRYWDEPGHDGDGPVAVIGAGLTAAHLVAGALDGGRTVHWVMRSASERYQCSDVNAAFFRAEGRARFDGTSWADRLALMGRERRASVMFEFQPGLAAAERDGRLVVHRGRAVTTIRSGPAHEVEIGFRDGDPVRAGQVRLALGTTPSIGTGLLSDSVVAARDGWPDLDARTLAYRAAPRVFAVGATACMVLGPAARNIDGHRVATARVAGAVAAGLGARSPDQSTVYQGGEDEVAARA